MKKKQKREKNFLNTIFDYNHLNPQRVQFQWIQFNSNSIQLFTNFWS